MKRYWMLASLVSLVGCGLHTTTPKAPGVAELRAAAAARPGDANAARELALAELFGRGGDPARLDAELAQARKLDPGSPRLLLAAGLASDVHGHPRQALQLYLQAIEAAANGGDPEATALIEVAAYAVGGADGSVPGYVEQVRTRLLPLLQRAGLAGPARAAVGDVLMPLAYRRGDMNEVAAIAGALGCVTELRVVGPFGPRELLGFDAPPPADPAAVLGQEYDLGAGRGVRATRTVHARGCTVHLGGGPVAEAGTTLAQAQITTKLSGQYLVRLDTPNSVELFVDGRSVQRIDRRAQLHARVLFSTLILEAGPHTLAVRISARHPNPVLELSLLPLTAADVHASELPFGPEVTDGFPLYLRVAAALVRGDVLLARQTLSAVGGATDASPLVLLQRASVALGDPLLPDDVRSDDAARYLGLAAKRDHELWAPVTQLATLAAKNGRVREAITALREAAKHWPQPPAIGFALVELLRDKGRKAELEREVVRLRELVPDACGPLSAQLQALRDRQRYAEAAQVAQQLSRCDAQSNALYTLYLSQRDFAAADKEQARLMALEPPEDRFSWLLAGIALAKNRGDEASVSAKIAELRALHPRAYSAVIEQLDSLLGRGDNAMALAALDAALVAEPASMAGLYRLSPVLGGHHVLAAYRKDGRKAITDFEASGRSYDGPEVLVLDYMAARVFEDGSSLELVHTVQKVQSDESVNRLAEVEVPEGAQVLTLRAWKPDGRKLEADAIAGKDSVSLPNVAVGDYVEFEYLQANAPADGFPHGYLGERFYFKSFEVPFHHSQMVMILPKDMPYRVDPRGPAPKLEEKLDGALRVLNWQVDQSLPLVGEPNSVSAREFIPSIRLGVNATWPAMIESLRDALVDRDLYDPYYAQLVKQIVGEAAPSDYRLRAERLYDWVLANVENNNDVFSQAALMLRAKAGNRARVLHYLLGLAGVPSKLALARNFAGDSTESEMADADTYDHLLVRVDVGEQQLWLFTVERWAPFGFMPPILRGQAALLLEPGAPRVTISQGLLGEDSRKFSLEVSLHADGSAHIDALEALHGSEAISWRTQLEKIPAPELRRRFEQDYVSRLFPGARLSSLQVTGREQNQPDLSLAYAIEVQSFGRRVEGGLALPPILSTELSSSFARTASRKTTELIPTPVHSQLIVRIHLPAGAKAPAPTPAIALTAAFAGRPSFTEQTSADHDVLVVERNLTLPAMRVSPEQYPVFTEFCRRVDQAEGREMPIGLP
ncbi:MAG TPA: DUF3857 domain-containing protein [Polyangiales bacterium]